MHNSQGRALSSRKRKKTEEKAECYLPDEIIIDIVSRLPAKDVLACRRVCSRWRDLTSGQDFSNLHAKRSTPMVLVQHTSNSEGIEHFFLNKWWEPERKRSVVHRFDHQYSTLFSHRGLIVSFKDVVPDMLRDVIVFNPMNGESVKITFSEEICWSDICGVFYHPSLKEYCTLWRTIIKVESVESYREHTRYKMLNLGSNPQWREIRNPWSHRLTISGNHAVLFDSKYLYWLVEDGHDCKYYITPSKTMTCHFEIMEFDVIREEFTLIPMPCPLPVLVKNYDCNLKLLNIDGVLSLVQIFGSMKQIDVSVWTLKDREKQLWSSSHYSIGREGYPKKANLKVRMLKPIAVVNEELVFQSDRRLFVCSLKQGIIRKVGKKSYGYDVLFWSHSMTFASLKNCTSNISMVEDGMMEEEPEKRLVSTNSLENSDKSC